MSDPAVQIIARGPRAAAEAAAAALDAHPALEGLTYSILEEDEDRGLWRIDAFPTEAAEAERLREALGAHAALSVATEVLADADWLAMALSGLPPVRAGRFFVYGAHDRGLAPGNTVNLRIEAGAAFGTGHHGTTVGCLQAFDGLLKRARFSRVLDVGCGTGVLAIAAARARCRFLHASGLGDARVRAGGPYDLVFANILARPLVSLAPDIAGALEPGGRAILSGLLRTQERLVRAAYLARGLRLERRIHRDAWATLVLRRG